MMVGRQTLEPARNPLEGFNLLLLLLLLSILELSDTKVYEPEIRARLGTASHCCEVVGRS